MSFKTWFQKNLTRRWFWVLVVTAFAAAICGFQIDSYRADKYNLNTLYIFLTIVLSLLSIYLLVFKVAKFGGGSPQ